MLEHNQIISRRRVANCIYGRLNAKQIEVEVKPVDNVSSRRNKNPVSNKACEKLFFSLNSRKCKGQHDAKKRNAIFVSHRQTHRLPEEISLIRINIDTIGLLIGRKKRTRQWELATKENYSKQHKSCCWYHKQHNKAFSETKGTNKST